MPKIKNILIFVAIAIIFVLIYVYFIKGSSDSNTPSLVSTSTSGSATSASTTTSTTEDNSAVANDFLTLLSSVQTIQLDDAIFSDDAFNSLHDSSIILTPDGTEGRVNPFAPIGTDAVTVPATTTIPPVTTKP